MVSRPKSILLIQNIPQSLVRFLRPIRFRKASPYEAPLHRRVPESVRNRPSSFVIRTYSAAGLGFLQKLVLENLVVEAARNFVLPRDKNGKVYRGRSPTHQQILQFVHKVHSRIFPVNYIWCPVEPIETTWQVPFRVEDLPSLNGRAPR